eukprot:SAG22_NODE_2930_length_2096_cov_157.828743_3_plen_94_part_00
MGKVKALMIEKAERASDRKRIKELEEALDNAEFKCLYYEDTENPDRKLLEKSHKNNKELRKRIQELESELRVSQRSEELLTHKLEHIRSLHGI